MVEKKKLSFFQNLIWNSAGSIIYLICQWLLTFVVVKFSSNYENAGNLSLAISITNIFYTVSCFNVRPFLVSDIDKKYSDRTYISFRVISCIFSLFFCIIYGFLFNYSMDTIVCIGLFMIFKLGEAFVDLLHGFEQREDRMDIGGISLVARGILSLVSFTVTLMITDNINLSIIVMNAFTFLAIFIYDIPKARQFVKLQIHLNIEKTKQIFIELLPLVVGTVMNTFSATFPRQMLESIMGKNNLGIYATVAAPAAIVQVAASYVFNPMQTLFANYKKNNQKEEFLLLLRKTSYIIIFISVICCIGVALFGEWGLAFLYNEEIAGYAELLLPVILFSALNSYVWFLANVLIVLRKLKQLMLIYFIGLLISVTLTIPTINIIGMNGVTITMITYSLCIITIMYHIVKKTIKREDISEI